MYTPTIWKEHSMNVSAKLVALGNIETQYDEAVSYLDSYYHDPLYHQKAYCNSTYFTSATDGSGSGLICQKLDGYSSQEIIDAGVPSGLVVIWSGSQASIPSGYHLCDGTNGTPNLINRFVLGAGGSYTKGQTGGSATLTPAASNVTIAPFVITANYLPPHTHGYTDYYMTGTQQSDGGGRGPTADHSGFWTDAATSDGHNHTASFAGDPCNILPKHWSLCYIMKG